MSATFRLKVITPQKLFFDDETETYIGTTHIPDVAIMFCEQHKDCYIKRNHSSVRLAELEKEYLW